MTDRDDDELPELRAWTVPPPPAGLVDRAVTRAAAPAPAVAREAVAPPRSGLRLALMLVAASAGGAAIASGFWAAAYERASAHPDRATGEASYVRPPEVRPMRDGVAGATPLPPREHAPVATTRRVDAAERARLAAALGAARTARTAAAAGTPAQGTAATADALDPADIQAAVREVVPLLAECFEQAPAAVQARGGTLVAELTVRSEPDVGTVIDDATFLDRPGDDGALRGDADFTECVRETLLSVEMPPLPDDGGELTIHYPFTFREDADDGEAPEATDAAGVAKLVEIAETALAAGQDRRALDIAQKVLVVKNEPRARVVAAIASCRLGDLERATRHARELDGDAAAKVRDACRRAGVTLATTDTPTVDELVARANAAAVSGNYTSALGAADQALALDPGNEPALTTAAIAACNLQRAERARGYLGKLTGERKAMALQICRRFGVPVE